MEVRGYANAADWVYGRAIDPGEWSGDERISTTEVRYVHRLAMEPVWDVAPHPDAGADEGPGAFRRHDIQPFPAGNDPATLDRCAGAGHRLGRRGERP